MKGSMLLKKTVSKLRESLKFFNGLRTLKLKNKTGRQLPHIRTQENGGKSALTKEPLQVLPLAIIQNSETQTAGHVALKSLLIIKWISASIFFLILKLQE